MKVAVINYGMGNLGSVRRSLENLGADVIVAEHPIQLLDVNRIILPGVGSFGEGMKKLSTKGWIESLQKQVIEEGKPLLGICLGMQMLSSSSEENGLNEGLNFISGKVLRLDKLGCRLRIPHVGWNEVNHQESTPLFKNIPQSIDFYFVHSYALIADDTSNVIATSNYDISITSSVSKNHIFGTQFHPEKSSKAGQQILKNFIEFASC
ncbi:imidazole glycerol phosphate synthase subunit HisH [Pseudanabaena galeata UHCC 0370]|jgi:imidazole glycerol-phosphate synthase subunit HisH|uniref:Imidazole glycerol phosphate synthase subunit HisH n=1 Tax=Pseudanabaena galeata UHCC 0370 TaxID=3110310 RepID=A0ABU5TM30_9CYAN|nr:MULTISPECIES: imidazole glycerol phosphate synthase subunit HisH [Pseudanabaena]MEA5479324.1 imidazole glycerol phosphate synthase subunit HisH [Pseudanabaena galeata UHCC 0370]MEA5487705.1 imidazole glycerol phosphate synthase subunit HisH [Pseudanabaena sp. CCNP1317]WGS70826.1 imidazole glycerol phosphate synthase subunit HisH [Pseudanabaena galeata CCNP1313]